MVDSGFFSLWVNLPIDELVSVIGCLIVIVLKQCHKIGHNVHIVSCSKQIYIFVPLHCTLGLQCDLKCNFSHSPRHSKC